MLLITVGAVARGWAVYPFGSEHEAQYPASSRGPHAHWIRYARKHVAKLGSTSPSNAELLSVTDPRNVAAQVPQMRDESVLRRRSVEELAPQRTAWPGRRSGGVVSLQDSESGWVKSGLGIPRCAQSRAQVSADPGHRDIAGGQRDGRGPAREGHRGPRTRPTRS